MLWYGLIPLGESDPAVLATLGGRTNLPLTARCIARRLAERIAQEPLAVDVLLGGALANTPEVQSAILSGLADGLKKATSVPMPVAWAQFAAKLNDIPDPALDAPRAALDKLFLAGQRLPDAARTVIDPNVRPAELRDALQQLMEAKAPALRDLCAQLATDFVMRFPAALVLTSLDDPRDTAALFTQAKALAEPERGLLYSALASRPQHALALLTAIVTKTLPRTLLTPAVIEKLQSHGNETLDKTLDKLPPAPAEPPAKPPRRR